MSPICFEEILPLWKNELWPGRESRIEPVSAMLFGGGIDIEIQKISPVFLGVRRGGELVGAISGVGTGANLFRIRGLIVVPSVRKEGVGSRLVSEMIRLALKQNFRIFWTAPRKDNLGFYQRHGFVQVSDWTKILFAPGPNCYAAKCITEEEALKIIRN